MESESAARIVIGRYVLHSEVARGGMATVYLGCVLGDVGFSRRVAIKRLHPQYASERDFISMFFDEANLAARINHPNVVPVIDVVASKGELLLVMEYVHGLSLARLQRVIRPQPIPAPIVARITIDTLLGLHAAHESNDGANTPLNIVHRDVSPQNILVGADGTSRITDFGVARAARTLHHSSEGQLKGKLAYMAPEQLKGEAISRQADLYAAGVVCWGALTGQPLFADKKDTAIIGAILHGSFYPPSSVVPSLAPYDSVLLRSLQMSPGARYATAREMAAAIERCGRVADAGEVADWVSLVAGEPLAIQRRCIDEMESATDRVALNAEELAHAVSSSGTVPPRTASSPSLSSPGSAGGLNVSAELPIGLRHRTATIVVASAAAFFVVLSGIVLAVSSSKIKASDAAGAIRGAEAVSPSAIASNEPPVAVSASRVTAVPPEISTGAASASAAASTSVAGSSPHRRRAPPKGSPSATATARAPTPPAASARRWDPLERRD